MSAVRAAAVPTHGPTDGDAAGADQRARILQTALRLMAEGGYHGTSMRKLATACGLNVATLYHYFPSKAELFSAAVAHQRIDLLLGEPPPMLAALPPRERLEAFVGWLLAAIPQRGDHIWRLLLGESLRGEPLVVMAAAELSAAFEAALTGWLRELFADEEVAHPALARLVQATVYGCIVESLLVPDAWSQAAPRRAADLARLVFR